MEITHRIFADDLSTQLSEIYNENISFASKSKFTDTIIQKYLADHFSVIVNNKRVLVNYLGYELEEDAIWIYEEVKNVGTLSSVEIKNTLLMDFSDEQSNIVHFKYGEETKSYQLTSKKPECNFSGFAEW